MLILSLYPGVSKRSTIGLIMLPYSAWAAVVTFQAVILQVMMTTLPWELDLEHYRLSAERLATSLIYHCRTGAGSAMSGWELERVGHSSIRDHNQKTFREPEKHFAAKYFSRMRIGRTDLVSQPHWKGTLCFRSALLSRIQGQILNDFKLETGGRKWQARRKYGEFSCSPPLSSSNSTCWQDNVVPSKFCPHSSGQWDPPWNERSIRVKVVREVLSKLRFVDEHSRTCTVGPLYHYRSGNSLSDGRLATVSGPTSGGPPSGS